MGHVGGLPEEGLREKGAIKGEAGDGKETQAESAPGCIQPRLHSPGDMPGPLGCTLGLHVSRRCAHPAARWSLGGSEASLVRSLSRAQLGLGRWSWGVWAQRSLLGGQIREGPGLVVGPPSVGACSEGDGKPEGHGLHLHPPA